jgi:hypothetical protein
MNPMRPNINDPNMNDIYNRINAPSLSCAGEVWILCPVCPNRIILQNSTSSRDAATQLFCCSQQCCDSSMQPQHTTVQDAQTAYDNAVFQVGEWNAVNEAQALYYARADLNAAVARHEVCRQKRQTYGARPERTR